MAMPEIEEVKDLALKYDKQTLGRMAQMGQVSPTLAVMAGMMRDRIVQSEMKPPQQTVAEEVMQPANQNMGLAAAQQMPQQAPQQMPPQQGPGLDQVPIPANMFDERRMASGGIVAFQAGGQASLQDVLRMMSRQELQDYQRTGRLPEQYRMMLAGAEAAPTFTGSLRDATQADTGAQFGARPLTGSQIIAQKADAAGNIYARPAPPMTTDVSGMPGTFAPYEDVVSQLGQGVPEPVDPFSATQGRTEIRGGQTDPGFVPQDRTPSAVKKTEERKVQAGPTKEAAGKKEEGPKTYDAYLTEITGAMGTSKVGEAMRKDIDKDRKARKEAKEQAGWMRLVEAGLGIMGGESPYALVNIGKGATNALKGYADDLREQKKLDREDRKILLDLDRAERAEQRDNYKLAAELREKALDRMSAEERTRISAEASRYAADVQERVGKMAYSPGGLKSTTEATIRNNALSATEGKKLMDPQYREAQKRKDTVGMMRRENEIFQEELRKLTPGGGMNVNTSALGPVIDFQTALGAR
jgi:hypothetical protein